MNLRNMTVLAETWMPIATIGAECMRERGASSALPPLYFIHVWWARRPLTISRTAILASVLPAWNRTWPLELRTKFPDEQSYRDWFLRLLGIMGDPVAGRKRITAANALGEKLKDEPYGYKRAFTYNPTREQVDQLGDLLEFAWGRRELKVMDAMAGGGSIPFEALRYGFPTLSNELNPVASVILKATLDYPARFGLSLRDHLNTYGKKICARVNARLGRFFPKQAGESIHAYIWARTVACPSTGKPVPLSPNWWLRKDAKPVAMRLVAKPEYDRCRFEILTDKQDIAAAKPDEGTVARGIGRSPWTGDPIDGDYIKAEAKAGRMGAQLYAVGTKTTKGFVFRAPTDDDLAAVEAAERELERRLPDWEARGLVPREPFPEPSSDPRPLHYGMPTWADFFSSRQLLSLLTFVDELQTLRPEMEEQLGKEKADAVRTYLGFMLDKGADRNSYMARWIGQRQVIANTFDRHDFSFKWSFAEFDAAGNLFPWTLSQVVDAYEGIAKLIRPDEVSVARRAPSLSLTKGPAKSLTSIADGAIDLICVDPPYHDNVMYAECADFFYVWMKRAIGDIYPEWFANELTNKDDEATANAARFKGMKKPGDLATADYERKMAACFGEMHRVLQPDGILTVMFTHKEVDAWNGLAQSLIGAGFSVETSWPVPTEFEHSVHQAKKNAAASTILLVCRKRREEKAAVWWDDLKGEVRRTAREKARDFHAQGISGADLYISSFGPVLSILSQNWPVLSSETDAAGNPTPLKPETALDLAREEVIALRKAELLYGREVKFDPVTDWYLMAWDAFRAEEFRADEARKLALALGLNLDADLIRAKKVVTKKSASVVMQLPGRRVKRGMVDPDLDAFDCLLDAAHTAMTLYDDDGPRACGAFLTRTGLLDDVAFKALAQAMINAIPRTRDKTGAFVRPEAKTLDDMRANYFPELSLPKEEAPAPKAGELFGGRPDV